MSKEEVYEVIDKELTDIIRGANEMKSSSLKRSKELENKVETMHN